MGVGAQAVQRALPWFDLIVVADSLGVQALSEITAGLPADFPVPIAFVLHRSERVPGIIAEILGRRTSLQVRNAAAGETPQRHDLCLPS